MIIALTKQDKANEIATEFKKAYWEQEKGWIFTQFGIGCSWEIYEALCNLPLPKTPEAIENIIGNSSWTTLECNECNESVDVLISIGHTDEEGYETSFCIDCLQKAIELGKQRLKDNK